MRGVLGPRDKGAVLVPTWSPLDGRTLRKWPMALTGLWVGCLGSSPCLFLVDSHLCQPHALGSTLAGVTSSSHVSRGLRQFLAGRAHLPCCCYPFPRVRHCPLPRTCCGSHRHQDPSPWCLLVLVRVSLLLGSLQGPQPSHAQGDPRARVPLGVSCPHSSSGSSLTPPLFFLPTDPWDPGVTAQDFLFRGGHCYQYQTRVVLDVTEQVNGPWVGQPLTARAVLTHSCSSQLSRFLWDHGDIAFAPLGKLMLENFRLEGNRVRSRHWPGGRPATSLVRPEGTNLTGLPCRATRKR